jgi:hypothetical protein
LETKTDTIRHTCRAISYGEVEADSAALTVALDSLLLLPEGAVYETHTEGLSVSVGRSGRALKVASRTFAQKPRLEIEESEEYNAVIAKVASEEKKPQPATEKHGALWTLRNISYILCSMVVLFAFLWILWWPLKWGINVLKKRFNV